MISIDRIGPWLVIAAGLVLISGTLVHPLDGHSFYLNTNWHAGFLAELRAGAWYPRWLSTTNGGLGAPSFYFYAPLPFYVSAALDLLWPFAHGPAFGPVAMASLAVVLSGLAMFALIRGLHGAPIAVATAVIYMAMPYHFAVDFWWRAALGELWAFVWLPLMAVGILRQARGGAGAILLTGAAAAGMILSHLPSFVIGAVGLGVIGCVAIVAAVGGYLDRAATRRVMLSTIAAIAVALLSTAAYWYPALTTTHLTVMNVYMTEGWYAYGNNFIFQTAVLPGNARIQNVGMIVLAAGALASLVAILRGAARSTTFAMALAVFAISLFLTTGLSALVYDLLPPLQRLQFPWRFLLLAEIALAVLLAGTIASLWRDGRMRLQKGPAAILAAAAAVGLLCLAQVLPSLMRPDYTPDDLTRLAAQLKVRADADEYRTRHTGTAFFYDIVHARRQAPREPRFTDESEDAPLAGVRAQTGRLVLPRFWYPDLLVRDRTTGRELATSPQAGTGLAVVDIPAGRYDIAIARRTMDEVATGHRLSLAGLLSALGWSAAGLCGAVAGRRQVCRADGSTVAATTPSSMPDRQHGMMQLLMGLLFLAGLPICMFVLPTSWWPYSTFGWFIGFIAFERLINRIATAWRGHPLPAGPLGAAIGVAITIDDSAASSGDGGDGGGDGGAAETDAASANDNGGP